MSDQVPADQIETLVGAARDPIKHLGRLRSEDHRIYILHSEKCLGRYDDLRECPFSTAMDRGLQDDDWAEFQDKTVALAIRLDNGPARLVPADLVH